MALITYILIAIPVCLLAIILWLYFNYWKYKTQESFHIPDTSFLSGIVVCTIYGQKRNAKFHFHRMQTRRENWNIPKTE